MARHRPWYKRFPADFIHGVRGLSLEAVGAYSLLIDILNDRDAPLVDDARFIAGLLGVPTQRWNKLRTELLRAGKITIDKGHLTNPRFERERAERHILSAEAAEHGRHGAQVANERRQQEMDLEPPARARARTAPETSEKSQLNRKENAITFQLPSEQSDLTPHKTAKNDQGTPRPRARATQRLRDSDRESTPTTESVTREGRLANADLKQLFDAVCEASGLHLVDPSAIDRAMRQVEAWRKENLDFDEVVLPAIRSVVAGSSPTDHTRTLGRFRFAIAREQALFLARGKNYRPPEPPLLLHPDEPPQMESIRQTLCQVMGSGPFALWFNQLRLVPSDERSDWIIIEGHMSTPLVQSNSFPTVQAVLRRKGFEHVFAR